MLENFKYIRTLFIDEAYMVPMIKIGQIYEIYKNIIDQGRNKASLCLLGD